VSYDPANIDAIIPRYFRVCTFETHIRDGFGPRSGPFLLCMGFVNGNETVA
jgi:hypothetical protein